MWIRFAGVHLIIENLNEIRSEWLPVQYHIQRSLYNSIISNADVASNLLPLEIVFN